MSIQSYLHEIATTEEPLRSSRMTSLTALSGDERAELDQLWPTIPVERRRQLTTMLAELTEDNVEYDFDAIFFRAMADPDPEVRLGGVKGLWEHTDRDVISPLIDLLRTDPIPVVRAEAALALGRFVMLGEFDQARPSDVEAVTQALRETLTDPMEPVEVRSRAVEAIGASSQPWARDIIHDAYASDDPDLMTSAVHAMGRSADPYWLPTILEELRSTDAEMRYEAAAACGMLEDEDAVPHLLELLEDEDDPEVAEQAVGALGEIGGEDAVNALRRHVENADIRISEAARLALDEAEFGDDPLGFRG